MDVRSPKESSAGSSAGKSSGRPVARGKIEKPTYDKTVPCVLCFDEIDAIGMERGDRNDVSEMSRFKETFKGSIAASDVINKSVEKMVDLFTEGIE